MLLGIGVIWVLVVSSVFLLAKDALFTFLGDVGPGGNVLAIFAILANFPAFVLIIISLAKWNSEK